MTADEKRVLRTFDRDLGRAQKSYQEFTDQALKRRIIRAAYRTPASEIWQEQFQWILDHSNSQESNLYPLDALRVAIYLATKAGIPPRAIGRALGQSDGKQASQVSYRMSKLLSEDPILKAKVDSLHVL